MDWQTLAGLILGAPHFQGSLYRNSVNTQTIIDSRPESLEIGPLDWDLPKTIKFNRQTQEWFCKEGDKWEMWEKAELQGVPVFLLLDPRYYAENRSTVVSASPDGVILRVRFEMRKLLEPMNLPQGLVEWCVALSGEIHEVHFGLNAADLKTQYLRVMAQRDFWFTGEDTMAVVFGEKMLVIPAEILADASTV